MMTLAVFTQFFEEKCESKSAMALKNLINSNISRTVFFNSDYGRTIEECDNVNY